MTASKDNWRYSYSVNTPSYGDMIISKANLELALLALPRESISLIKLAIAGKQSFKGSLVVDYAAYQNTIKDIKVEAALSIMRKAAVNLMNRQLKYSQNNYHVITPLLYKSSCTDNSEKSILTIELSDELSSGLAAYPEDELMEFLEICVSQPLASIHRAYSSKFYLLLLERCVDGVAVISYSDLRKAFALDSDAYALVQNFKRRILKSAISDMAEHADLKVTYSDITNRRIITGFKFILENIAEG